MMRALALLASLAVASLAFAGAAQDAPLRVTLAFAPAAPARLERRLSIEHELSVRSASQMRGGNVYKSEQSAEIKTKETLAVTDELRALADGRPGALRRGFDQHVVHAEITLVDRGTRAKPGLFDAHSVLESCGIVYTWVPAERDWGRYYDAREELEEHLADLRQDLDFLALLPERPVATGDAWDVPAERWIDVLAPCGRLEMRWPKDLDRNFARSLSTGIGGGLSELFGGEHRGGGKVRLARVDEQGGVKRAVLEIELDLTLARDQDPSLVHRGAADDPAAIAGPRVHIEWRFQARGTLAWNLTERRAERLTLSGLEQIDARYFGGVSSTPTEEATLGGALKLEATIAPKR